MALLLALGIVVSTRLHADGFIGILGLYCATDGVLAGLAWLIDRRFKMFALEGALGVALGFVIMMASGTATGLLILFSLRAILMAGAHAWSARTTLPRRDALVQFIGAGVCAAIGLAFLTISAFGYDALELYACIAGYLAVFGATLGRYAFVLRRYRRPAAQPADGLGTPGMRHSS